MIDGSRQSQLLRGVLDLCLLQLTAEKSTYGYEMIASLDERGLQGVALSSIYPVLARLERTGLVCGSVEGGSDGPPRRYYRATEEGLAAIAAWREAWRATRDGVDAVLGEPAERSVAG